MADENELPGQGQEETPPGTDQSESLAGDEGASSGTEGEVDVVKELQDRLSAQGRELQAERNARLRAEGYVGQVATRLQETEERLQSIGASLTEREKREEEAYLAGLPPQDQEAERLRRRVARLETALTAQTSQQQRARTRQQDEAETVRRAAAMTEQACIDFGLDGDEKFQWNDPRLDLSSAEAYYASARKLARKISAGQESATPPQPTANVWGGDTSTMTAQRGEPKRAAPNTGQVDVQKIVADTTKAVLKELQGQTGGAPHTARPATPAASPFADLVSDRKSDPYQQVLDSHRNPAQSPMRATRAKLKEIRDQAEAAFGRAAR